MNDRLRGIALVGGAAVLWSTGGALVRFIDDADSWTIIFWRSASAAAVLLLYMLFAFRERLWPAFKAAGWPGVMVGLCFASSSICMVIALGLTSVANVLIIVSTMPLIAAIFGRVFLGERIGPITYLAIGAVIGGIALMASGSMDGASLLGSLFALGMAASYAGAIVVGRRYPQVDMMPGALLGAAFALVISAFVATPVPVSAHDLTIMILFGAGQLGVAMALFVTGVRLIPAAQAALVATLEPILGPVWVWLAFGEQPGARVIAGGLIVLAAVTAKTLLDQRGAIAEPPAV